MSVFLRLNALTGSDGEDLVEEFATDFFDPAVVVEDNAGIDIDIAGHSLEERAV